MADARYRSIARRALSSGCPDDQARYLRERVRVGEITNRRLEAAAILGHEPSRLAIPDSYYTSEQHRYDTVHSGSSLPQIVVRRLANWGLQFQVRMAITISSCIYDVWLPGQADNWARDVVGAPFRVIRTAAAWAVCPCEQHQYECGALFQHLQETLLREDGQRAWTVGPILLIVWSVVQDMSGNPTRLLLQCLHEAEAIPFNHNMFNYTNTPRPNVPILDPLHTCVSSHDILRALREQLIPWILGERDPLEERHGRD